MSSPSFLELPDRTAKPRSRGVTHVLDKGRNLRETLGLLDHAANFIDIVKIGWGIGYIDSGLRERVAAYRAADVLVSLGGTLLEIAEAQGKIEEMRAWALDVGISMVEVSDGLCAIERARKTELVRMLSQDFIVAAEVGSKNADTPVVIQDWLSNMAADLEAGARWVVAEGRESGTVGIYQGDGEVRDELVEALQAGIPIDRIIFEAPSKAQQTWFIRTFGANVNLGNIPPEEVLALETLRLGLRADTAVVNSPALATNRGPK